MENCLFNDKEMYIMSHDANGRLMAHNMLWEYALIQLEKELEPLMVLVYGQEQAVVGLNTPLKFFPDFISTRLRCVHSNRK